MRTFEQTLESADMINAELDALTPEERLDVFDRILIGFCRSCGEQLGKTGTCHCENDD